MYMMREYQTFGLVLSKISTCSLSTISPNEIGLIVINASRNLSAANKNETSQYYSYQLVSTNNRPSLPFPLLLRLSESPPE
jgi:hypothetical protein